MTDLSWRETAADRQRTMAVLEELAYSWQCCVRMTTPGCPADGRVYRNGRHVGFVEVKVRTGTCPETVMVDVSKVEALERMLETELAGDGRAVFVVQYADGIYWTDIEEIGRCRIFVTGRAGSRNEPAYSVPRSYFRTLVRRRN